MIVCNGIVGLCLLAGGLRHRELVFQLQGAQAALSVIIPLTTLTMVFPNVTSTTPGPTFSSSQFVFVAIISQQPRLLARNGDTREGPRTQSGDDLSPGQPLGNR
jgi:hypothetical protein